jgi:hypothetical protein
MELKKAQKLDTLRAVAKEREKLVEKQKEAQHFLNKAGEVADLNRTYNEQKKLHKFSAKPSTTKRTPSLLFYCPAIPEKEAKKYKEAHMDSPTRRQFINLETKITASENIHAESTL